MNAPLTEAPDALTGVPAPAKLNLFLHIVGRRPDGYHLLQSVFMLIDWQDTLDFHRREDGLITREDIGGLELPPDDLCTRAARLLQARTGTAFGAHIRLHKQLPAEAGMGGGSSDAATTLLALNRLWNTGLRRPELADLAQQLGADVPFFIHGNNAWVEGIGEKITPVVLPVRRWAVVKPPGGASTQLIFRSENLTRDTKTAILAGFAANNTVCPGSTDQQLSIERLLDDGHNDLEPVAKSLCGDVDLALQWLSRQGLSGRMTGSGTAVFALMREDIGLEPAPEGWNVQICSNLAVHPLRGWCSD